MYSFVVAKGLCHVGTEGRYSVDLRILNRAVDSNLIFFYLNLKFLVIIRQIFCCDIKVINYGEQGLD